jgi:hypothetical protein
MSLRKTVSYSDDPKNHRDEDIKITTAISHNGLPTSHADTTGISITSGSQQTLASDKPTWSTAQSSLQRWVVIPDPAAFQYASTIDLIW